MDNSSQDSVDRREAGEKIAGDRMVYVLPQELMANRREEEIDLLGLAATLWKRKWMISIITGVFVVIAVIYSLLATEWYRAEVVLMPAKDGGAAGLAGRLSGLAALAGIDIGSSSSNDGLAVLKSRAIAESFIEELGLLPILYSEQWDPEAKRWRSDAPDEQPDMRDAVQYFDKTIRTVSEDPAMGTITVAIQWTDPELTASWANAFVSHVNEHMRLRALSEAEANVTYLKTALSETSVLTLQEAISRIMESEMQKLMLARGNDEFAFRVIDRAVVPKQRFKPHRTLIVLLAAFLGGVFGTFVVLIRYAAQRRNDRAAL